jgi:hypothetical protein
MSAEASVLVFEAGDLDSCIVTVREFFRQNSSANAIKVALSTPDLKPLGGREWRLVDRNFEIISRLIASFIMTQPHGSVTISARAD